MEVVSSYESRVIQYSNSDEMTKHIPEMERFGWKVVSISYGKLRIRYRRDE